MRSGNPLSEDISGCRQEKEERQTEESRFGNGARRKRGGDIAKEKLKVSKRRWPRTKESNAAAQEASISSRQNEITGSRRINPGRAKTQGE